MSNMKYKRKKLWDEQNGKCIYCDQQMWLRGVHKKAHIDLMATIEHIEPKGLGGGKSQSNITCSCSNCNRHRGQIEHQKFIKIRKHKNWEHLAKEEHWKMLGIYSRKKREYRFKEWRTYCKGKHRILYVMLIRYNNIIRFKNKHLHFTKIRINKLIKRNNQLKHYLNVTRHILRNKTKSLILNIFKQFEIHSFKPLST